jgi:hypothetical protein
VRRGHLSGSVSLLRRDADPRWVSGDDAGNQPRSATCKASRRDGATGRDEVGSGDAGYRVSRSSGPCGAPPTSPAKHASSSRQTPAASVRPAAPRSCVGRSYAAMSDYSSRGSDLRFGGRGGTRTPDSCLVSTPRPWPPGHMRHMRRRRRHLAPIRTQRTAGTLAKCWPAATGGYVADPACQCLCLLAASTSIGLMPPSFPSPSLSAR